jgi:hypothetical protein
MNNSFQPYSYLHDCSDSLVLDEILLPELASHGQALSSCLETSLLGPGETTPLTSLIRMTLHCRYLPVPCCHCSQRAPYSQLYDTSGNHITKQRRCLLNAVSAFKDSKLGDDISFQSPVLSQLYLDSVDTSFSRGCRLGRQSHKSLVFKAWRFVLTQSLADVCVAPSDIRYSFPRTPHGQPMYGFFSDT